MNENELYDLENAEDIDDSFDLDDLEHQLQSQLEDELSDLDVLGENREKIGNPDTLGDVVKSVVWEQFCNQIAVVAGEDFIKENRGLPFDPRSKAHIQTTENFEKGVIATHNTEIDYQKRYDDWQNNFQKDKSGNTIYKADYRTGEEQAVLNTGARDYIDAGRPKGSASVHMDHTVPAAEIIRDPEANAHLSREEQAQFANGEINLQPLDAAANESKGDSKMRDWLNSERNGERPADRFDIDEKKLVEKDNKARDEYDKVKKEGVERSVQTGRRSQKQEVFRMGGKALRSAVMLLLADLVKNVIQKLISWLRSTEKKLKNFIDSMKEAISNFIANLKKSLIRAGDAVVTTIATAILGPIVGMIKKAWIFIKQGYNSLKEAIAYIKSPDSKKKPLSIVMLKVTEIVVTGLTVGEALVLSELIEKGLMSFPIFAVQIPLLGSLANILGIFLGAMVAGLIGALALHLIDKLIAKKQMIENIKDTIDKGNEIMTTQDKIIVVKSEKVSNTEQHVVGRIQERHSRASEEVREMLEHIAGNGSNLDVGEGTNSEEIDDIIYKLENI